MKLSAELAKEKVMAYVANDEEIDGLLDEVIEKNDSEGSGYVKDMNLLNNHITEDELEKAGESGVWFTVKWLVNQHNRKNTIVQKHTHSGFFKDSKNGFQSIGTRYCAKGLGEKYCPWDTLSWHLYNFKQKFPNHASYAKIDEAHQGLGNSKFMFTNVMVIDSNVETTIGKCFEFRIPIKAGYDNYIAKKKKGITSKGKVGKPVNVFAIDALPTTMAITKKVKGNTDNPQFNRDWAFEDDAEYTGQKFEDILKSINKSFDDVETFNLEQHLFENDEYVSDEHKQDVAAYNKAQYEDVKKWIYFNVPEIIPTATKCEWIKGIKDSDFIEDTSNENIVENEIESSTEGLAEFGIDDIDDGDVDDIMSDGVGDDEDDLESLLGEDE